MGTKKVEEGLKVTSIDELKAYSKGQLVEFPPFAEGQPFVPRVRRPSMLSLMKNGKIPNDLLDVANDLFDNNTPKASKKGKDGSADSKYYKNLFKVIEVLAEAAFVEPTLQDLKDADMELTDDQLIFLFNYAQGGVMALQSFR